MNDGAWEHSHRIIPPTPTTLHNPWTVLQPSQGTPQSTNTSSSHLLATPDDYAPRGRSTSLAGGGSSTTITYATSRLASSEREGDSSLVSGIRPRTRRRRSDVGSLTAAGTNNSDDEGGSRTNSYSNLDSSVMLNESANGSTLSLSSYAPTSASGTSKRPLQPRKVSNGSNNYDSTRPQDAQPYTGPEAAADFWDWDANDKTREGKARTALVQGKGKQRAGLAGPFSTGLKTVFGSKLWGEVETLWNETISPIGGYDNYHDFAVNGGQGGHAYLDVWGRPISKPSKVQSELERGRDTKPSRGLGGADGNNEGRRATGPLVEYDISPTTTPSLSRRTTKVERKTSKTLITDSGGDIFGIEKDGTAKANDAGEAEVFEHKVLSTDSLAGVALKYGITVAQLRKCNKMWTSDTIHLRKVLYIPASSVNTGSLSTNPPGGPSELVDLSSFDRRQRSDASRDPVDSSPSKSNYGVSSSPSGSNVSFSASSSSLTPSKSLTSAPSMKKVPLSELSYFPPSSTQSTSIFTSNPHPSTITAGTIRRWELENGFTATPFSTLGPSGPPLAGAPTSRTTSPSRSPLPSSIFSVFPSLNDLNDVTSRASFETVRSANGSMPGSGNVSGDENVELDELRGVGSSAEPNRQKMRRRVKVKHRPSESMEGKQSSRLASVITTQLAPSTMELPSLSNSPPRAAYGSGWIDPMGH